jgi:hypothetical protein
VLTSHGQGDPLYRIVDGQTGRSIVQKFKGKETSIVDEVFSLQ